MHTVGPSLESRFREPQSEHFMAAALNLIIKKNYKNNCW